MKDALDTLNGTLHNHVTDILDIIASYQPELHQCQQKLASGNILKADNTRTRSVLHDILTHMALVGENAQAALTTLHNMETLHRAEQAYT